MIPEISYILPQVYFLMSYLWNKLSPHTLLPHKLWKHLYKQYNIVAIYLVFHLHSNSNFFEKTYMLANRNPAPLFACKLLLTVSREWFPSFIQQIQLNNYLNRKRISTVSLLISFLKCVWCWTTFAMRIWALYGSLAGNEFQVFSWNINILTEFPWSQLMITTSRN